METKNRCIYPGELLIPVHSDDFPQWACVACDQFTSQPEYWEKAKLYVGDKPSTLNIVLPECYLAHDDERIPMIHQSMKDYLDQGVLAPAVKNGFVLTERNTTSGARVGIVGLLDLECYDYKKGSKSLVRATEETIEARIPPRLKVRRGAVLETSHVLMLMDDPMHSVVEPLFEKRSELEKVYDFPLMLGGGHLTGYAITSQADIDALYSALDALLAQSPNESPLLFAVGDGNHSLATAKANWEEIKKTLTSEQTTAHPARFAMVEIENIHDDALIFEPIHRVLFGYDGDDMLDEIAAFAAQKGARIADAEDAQEIIVVYEGKEVNLSIAGSPYSLAVGTLQAFLDQWLASHPSVSIDYIHGEDVVRDLVAGENAIGFLLPKPTKDSLFSTVIGEGSLPRKTFSMGEANEKRYYMEARKL